MAGEVTKKDFDALVKKVNNKFTELDKAIKALTDRDKEITDTTNEAIKTLTEGDQIITDNINKVIVGVNKNIALLETRIKKLE